MPTENQSHSQLELFSQIKRSQQVNQSPGKFFIYQMRIHEKAIILIIAFIATGIISFSLGIEKGKGFISQNQRINSRIDTAVNKPQPRPLAGVSALPDAAISNQEASQPVKGQVTSAYTIQVASYEKKIFAQKEAQALKKKGLSASVLSKGKYLIVCVGNFSNRNAAEPLLSELKKRYRDCMIRRL